VAIAAMSASDLQQRFDEARRELDWLRAENERLRMLLSLAQGTRAIIDTGNGAVRPQSSHPESGLSPGEKVALIRRLFRGRDDVYALRWENVRTGKRGYVPATANGWTKTGPRTYLPLTDEAIIRHLRGQESIGIYPLLEDDNCGFSPATSSRLRLPPPRRGGWARCCCARRWRVGPSSTSRATTGCSRTRTSDRRRGSAT
jgi:hypothetical protein